MLYDSVCAARAAPSFRVAVAHLIARVNHELATCSFAVDWSTGEVRCRSTAFEAVHDDDFERALDQMVGPNHQAMIDWHEHVMAVAIGEMEPDAAFLEAIAQVG